LCAFNIQRHIKEYDIKAELEKKINKLNEKINSKQITTQPIITTTPNIDIVHARDRSVTDDILYPPHGRTERPVSDLLLANRGSFNYPTRGSPDTYRPVAIVIDKQTEETYHMMGRQKYQGSSQGEFYLAPTDTHNRLKVQLLDERGNQLIRDIYNIPQEIDLESGIFKGKTFTVEELAKSDLTSGYY